MKIKLNFAGLVRSCLLTLVFFLSCQVQSQQTVTVLNPEVEGIAGVYPTGDVDINSETLELTIQFDGMVDYENTDDRFIRIFEQDTDRQIFSYDPQQGEPDEGTNSLTLEVPAALFEARKSYRVVSEHLFARLDIEPWNVGAIESGAWTINVLSNSTPPDPSLGQTTPLLEPVAGVNGVLPLGDVNIADLSEVPLVLETIYNLDFSYTEDRTIRIVESTSNEPVYTFNPEPGHADEGTTRLHINVPASVFEADKTYYVIADDIFARIDGEPWNLANIPSGAWPITPISSGGADKQIEAINEFMQSDVEPISDEEFLKSELAKQQMPDLTAARLAKAHSLALGAVDPEPEWFTTKVSDHMVVAQSAASYSIDVDKVDVDGNVLGPVEADKLRLEVRIQRGLDDFEYVPDIFADQYAFLDDGKLFVNTPSDLTRGRLIVGIRPDLDDEGQQVLAERWSTFVTFEVWPIKSNVISLTAEEVLFPHTEEEPFHQDLLIEQSLIASVTQTALDNDNFLLPIVTRQIPLEPGQAVSYTLGGDPYSGVVDSVQTVDGQTLALLSPDFYAVYDITESSPQYLIEQGVLPEHLVYREGAPVEGFDKKYTSQMKSFDPVEPPSEPEMSSVSSSATGVGRFFTFDGCYGKGEMAFTFSPVFSLDPVDAGLFVTAGVRGSKVECGVKAKSGIKINLLKFTGTPGVLMQKLVGSSLDASPQGSLKLQYERKLSTDDNSGLKITTGWSHNKGFEFDTSFNTTEATTRGLEGHQAIRVGTLGSELGLVADLSLTDANSAAGKLARYLKVKFDKVSVEFSTMFKLGLKVSAVNAPAVSEGAGSSEIGLKPSVEAKLKVSPTLLKLAKKVGIKGELFLSTSHKFGGLKGGNAFSAELASDNGQNAVVNQFDSNSAFLDTIFPPLADGRVAPEDRESSLHNDRAESILYMREECEASPDGVISAPVIACMGPYCGMTQDFDFCSNGELEIEDLVGEGEVGSGTAFTSKITLKSAMDKDVDVSVSDTTFRLEPEFVSLSTDLDKEDSAIILATHQCEQEGVDTGTYEVYADLGKNSPYYSGRSTVICSKDEDEPRDVVWGSPHLSTTDGFMYDYYASGDYILSRIPGIEGYEVQARFLPGKEVSWPQAAALQVGEDIVEVYSEMFYPESPNTGELFFGSARLTIYINGQEYRSGGLPFYSKDKKIFKLAGGGYLIIRNTLARFNGAYTDPTAISIIWPSQLGLNHVANIRTITNLQEEEWSDYSNKFPLMQIELLRDEEFAGLERGFLGDNDGDPLNDLIRRNGQVLDASETLSWTALYGLFGGDWLVRPQECLFSFGCLPAEFPAQPAIPDAVNRILAEASCQELEGIYYQACVHDVGLTGDPTLVQDYYSNSEDLNNLKDKLTIPQSDTGLYESTFGVRENGDGHTQERAVYSRIVNIEMLSGSGDYLLISRPPSQASLYFNNGLTELRGNGATITSFNLDCRIPDPFWSTLDPELWPTEGYVQLWALNPISGSKEILLNELVLSCNEQPQARLNDTGAERCYSFDSNTFEDCAEVGFTGQDGNYGRDHKNNNGQLTKVGSGLAGFDFTKIAANGGELAPDASEWSCVRDNVTGLYWEAKSTEPYSLHSVNTVFSWYNPNNELNGGNPGVESSELGICADTPCSTDHFVQVVNESELCGFDDWRMPTVNELISLRNVSIENTALDPNFFISHDQSFSDVYHWAANPSVHAHYAWQVNLFNRYLDNYNRYILSYRNKGSLGLVILVRGDN